MHETIGSRVIHVRDLSYLGGVHKITLLNPSFVFPYGSHGIGSSLPSSVVLLMRGWSGPQLVAPQRPIFSSF